MIGARGAEWIRTKAFWVRHAYPFLWSHKPWCDRFVGDTIRLGSIRLCRSCCWLYGGVLASLAFGFGGVFERWGVFSSPSKTVFFLLGTVGSLGPILFASIPVRYKRRARWQRDSLRFGLGFVLSSVLFLGAAIHPLFLLGALGGLFLVYRRFQELRVHQKMRACDGCPELETSGVCSGFVAQAERVRRFEEEATRRLLRSLSSSQDRTGRGSRRVSPIEL